MICFSATNALCSLLYGKISQFTGRAALYVLGRRPRGPALGLGAAAERVQLREGSET